MPLYSIQGPDGNTYSIEGPPGATREQVIQAIQMRLQGQRQAETVTAPPSPQPEQSGILRQALDIPVQVIRGGVGGIRMLADVFGAGSSASESLKSADTWLADLLSAQAKNDQRQIAQILKDAEDKGVLEQVKAGLKAFTVAPVDTLAQALGSTAPTLVAGLVSGPAGAALGIARAGAYAMPVIGAAMGVGDVKQSIYQSTKDAWKEKGYSEEFAEAKAQEAQAYSGANLPSLGIAAGLGALASAGPVERQLMGAITRKTPEQIAKEAIESSAREAERGVVARAGLGALKEGVPEFAQAAQSQLAQNLALIQQGFDTPLFQGVVSSGTVEGLAGAVLGGTLSLRRSGQDLLPGQNPGESDADFARRMSREIEAARREPPSPLTKPVTPTAPVVTAPEGEDVFRFPDGSVGTLDQARAYAMSLPPEQRASTLQSILTQRVPREKTVPPDLFTQPAEKPAEGAAPTKPVVAEKPAEEAKPEVVEPAKPPAVAMTKEEEEVAADAAKGKPEQSFVTGYEPVEVPLDQLKLSKEVPQFKADADQEGIVERLEGKFDRINTAPIQVWKRLDGSLEVISGRHRFDLAKRSGEKTIPAQIHDEATGFDADQASILDATLNIRDQQGKGRDYVAYFRKSGISEEEASARGLLARAPGKPAFAIAKNGSDELVTAHRADVVSDAGAAAIANTAPGDSRLQAVGIKAIQEGKSPLAAVNIIKAVQEVSKGRPAPEGGGDLFGFDDSAMREAEEMAKIATLKQNQIAQRLAAISGASKRPEIAKKEGIDIKDPEALKKREKELRQQKAAWDNWSSSSDLVQEIRKEMEPKAEKPSAREAAPAKEAKELSPAIQAKIDALGKALQRIMSRYGLKDVALKLVADMKAEGEYASKVLSLALDAVDPVSALRHESIHALKELGFFSPAQWKSLERQAKEKWVDQYLKQKNVNRQPLQPGQISRYDAYMKFYGGDEEAILEEAIADAFADFSATKAPPGMLQALLKKIQNFFQAVKEAFGAEPEAERIFKKVERGELRGKEVAAPEVAKAEEAKPSLRQVPLSTRGIMESSPVYAMDELGLKTTSEKKPGGIELFNDVRSIARALNNDTINREGAIKEKDYSISSALKLARAMADEISFQVGATAKTGTGLGWYSSNYPKSVKKLAKRFPELETDPYARTVFSALVAITSNGEKVATNVKNAINLYADIREGKAVVQPGSRRASAMENNLSTLKMLMDKFGPDLRAELMREITVKEMNAALRAAGEKPDTSYLADTKVPASAIYFGPKLGAFFSNLEGAEGYLTMDLWWTRTMNRMHGLLMPKATAASINKFRDLMDRPNATREEVVSATIPLRNKYEEFGFKTELEHLVGSKEPSSKSPDLPKWNRRARALAGPAYQQLVFEHRLEKLANTIYKNEFEMLEEAPFTASDRKFMYRTAREAQGMLRDNGIDLSLADIQAALWYYEKRLYQHLSGRKADDIGYDEAIEQLAGQSAGPAGPALVFNRQPAGGPGAAGAGTEADRLGGAGQAAKPSLRDSSWSEDRIATLIDKYSYLQNGREKDTKAYAGFVRPEEFLAATTAAEYRGRLESEKTPLDVQRLAKESQEIFLDIKPTDEPGVYQITGHEGRHRMMALRDAGVRSVPVVFYTGGTQNAEVVEEPYFKAQEFRGDKKIIKAQRGFSAMEMIPISWDQRNNIKETFGGKADVRFSLRDTVNVDGTERPTTSSTNKPIYPTEEGTKNFWRWFKDSAVVDEEGRPLVVYRGVDTDYGTTARVSKEGALGAGIYTTPSASFASYYAEGESPNVMPLYVSLQKPLLLKHKGNEDPMIMALVQLGMKQDKAEAMVEKAYEEKGYIGKQVMNRALSQGYDGLMQYRDGRLTEIVAFNPAQIKSAIGNVGKFDPVDPSIKASLRDTTDPAIRARVDQTTTARDEKSFIKRITEAIAPKSSSTFRAAFLDRYNRLSEYDKELVRQMGGAPLLADASAHSAALMSDLSAGVLAGAMGVHDGVGGIPVYVNGYTKIVNNNNTVKGPIAIFAPLAKVGDPFAYRAYQFWAGVKRGTRFDKEGREKLFEKDDIQKAEDLRKQFLGMGVDFDAIQKEWIKFNDGLVQYLKDTGVLSEAAAKEFVKYSDYIPFYRQVEGEETVGPQIFASLSGVRAPKKLKESELKIGEFLETVVRNVQYSIEAGMKNVAAQRAVNTAVLIGQANRLNYASSAPNVIKVLENGLTSYYATKDPLFVDAMKSLNLGDLPFIGLLAGPANLLRNLVTKDPAFMLANMMRDSMSAWVSSGVKMTPIVDTMTNFTKALSNQSPEYAALLNSGVVGGYDYSQGVEISARRFDRALRKKAGVYTTGEKLARPITSLWDALEKGTEASDAATRMEVYKKTLAETGNEAEALFRSLEVMNFNRKGNNPLVRVLTAAVPFLNARMQGLDVLYRAAFGKGTEANAKEIQKSFFIRGMTIAALSTMYWMLVHDDDEWKKQEQETRDNYWILGKVKIPIPFEIGVFFKVVPERILEYYFGNDTGKDFMKSMGRQLSSTLAFNPIPQVAMPVVEAVTNYSFFTGRPILSQGLEDVAPAYQVGPSTSRIGELAGAATKGLPSALQLSPMKVDQMIRGYTGTLGGYMMDLFDAIYDLNTDSPKASKRFEQMPVIKRFAVDPEARGQVTAYYELKNSVDEAVRTANLLERNMNPQEWGEFMQENMGLLATKQYVLDLEKSMKKYREMKTFVRASNMSAQEKEDINLDITKLENNLTSNIQQIKKMIAAQ